MKLSYEELMLLSNLAFQASVDCDHAAGLVEGAAQAILLSQSELLSDLCEKINIEMGNRNNGQSV